MAIFLFNGRGESRDQAFSSRLSSLEGGSLGHDHLRINDSTSRRAAGDCCTAGFNPVYVGWGSWLCENES
jgi:hypothetical protein